MSTRAAWLRPVAWLAPLVLLNACGNHHGFLDWGRTGAEHAQGSAKLGGDVLSTVDGVAITVHDVQTLVDASGLSPRAALTRLQSQVLLAGEAERRGYGKDPAVEQVAQQARVQALLARDVESAHATDAEIAAAYQKQANRFHAPELRGAVHILAAFPQNAPAETEAAARDFVEQAITALGLVEDPNSVFQEFAQRTSALFRIKVERLPEVAHNGAFVPPFENALFSVPKLGVVPEPVRTEFGFHAIYVTSIVPRHDVTLAEATPALRAELDVERRKQTLDELNKGLRAEIPAVEDRKGQQAIGQLEL